MSTDDYVLGTDAGEIERLGAQHRVWSDHMRAAWRRADIGPSMTVLDVGAGPGFATVDLAEQVGPEGRVVAIERSRSFVAALADRARAHGHANVRALHHDVTCEFGAGFADRAWCRWVLSFVQDPAGAVRHVARALKPGGIAVFHEYADYRTWRAMPPIPELERFCALVMRSWRDSGGEPDIALQLPALLDAAGLEIVSARPIIEIVDRASEAWSWPAGFIAINAQRLADLGYIEPSEARRFAAVLDNGDPHLRMITPLVAEVIARKPLRAGA